MTATPNAPHSAPGCVAVTRIRIHGVAVAEIAELWSTQRTQRSTLGGVAHRHPDTCHPWSRAFAEICRHPTIYGGFANGFVNKCFDPHGAGAAVAAFARVIEGVIIFNCAVMAGSYIGEPEWWRLLGDPSTARALKNPAGNAGNVRIGRRGFKSGLSCRRHAQRVLHDDLHRRGAAESLRLRLGGLRESTGRSRRPFLALPCPAWPCFASRFETVSQSALPSIRFGADPAECQLTGPPCDRSGTSTGIASTCWWCSARCASAGTTHQHTNPGVQSAH